MSQCIRERPKRSIFFNRTSNTGGQGLNRQYHDGGAEAPWQLHAPRRKTLTVGTKIRSNRSLDRAVLPRLSKGLSLEGRASRAPEARRAAGGATGDCAKAFKSRPSERAWGRPLNSGGGKTLAGRPNTAESWDDVGSNQLDEVDTTKLHDKKIFGNSFEQCAARGPNICRLSHRAKS